MARPALRSVRLPSCLPVCLLPSHTFLMRLTAHITLLALLCLAWVANAAEVVTLTDATFEHHTQAATGQTAGVWFVRVKSKTCGHCVRMNDEWTRLAEEMDNAVIVADIDGPNNPVTTGRFRQHVRGLPTMLLFRDRKVFKYTGARTVEAMAEFATATYADARAHDVPPEATPVQRIISETTKSLALLIIDTYDAADHFMSVARKDFAGVLAGFRKGGLSGAWDRSLAAFEGSPKMWGGTMIACGVIGVGFAMALALLTSPAKKKSKEE